MKKDKDYFGIYDSSIVYDDEARQETREMLAECNEMEEDEISDEWITESLQEQLGDERMNLNIETGGYIICFGILGLWNGHPHAAKIVGTNVRDILYSENPENEWYADKFDVRCNSTHHDGTNTYLYRMVDSKEKADNIMYQWVYGNPEKRDALLRKHTRSIRPFVANTYGWQQYGAHQAAHNKGRGA